MVHVFPDGLTLFIMEVEPQSIKQVNGTLTMMVIPDGIISFQMSGTKVMKQSYDTTAFIRKVWCKGPHLPIHPQGMFCQSSLEAVMVMAVCREIVTMLQIGNDVAYSLTIDITQQRDNLRFTGNSTTSIHPMD